MLYAYPFTLAKRAVVVTLDLAAKNLHLLKTDHWLSNPDNVITIWLQEPAIVGARNSEQSTPPQRLQSFSVADVAAFFEARDAEALGAILSKNSVNGQDLTVLGLPELTQDMRMSSFGARKVIALRDAFLGFP